MDSEVRNEAIIFLIDDGEASINRDYGHVEQTRLQAQADAVERISNMLFQRNPEAAVGIMTIGGHVTNRKGLSQRLGAVLEDLRTQVNCSGPARLQAGLKTASCALMSRGNRMQKPHVIALVCSSIMDSVDDLVRQIGVLRKTNMPVDIVSLNRLDPLVHDKLEEVATQTGIKYVAIPAGSISVADAILGESVVQGLNPSRSGAGGAGGAGGDDMYDEFGYMNNDDDYERALRESLLEAETREALELIQAANAAEEAATKPDGQSGSQDKPNDRMDES